MAGQFIKISSMRCFQKYRRYELERNLFIIDIDMDIESFSIPKVKSNKELNDIFK